MTGFYMKCNTGLKWVKPVKKKEKQDVKKLKIWNRNIVRGMKCTTKSQNLYVINNYINSDYSKQNGNMRSLTW